MLGGVNMASCINCKKEISAIEDNIYSGYCENCYEETKGKNPKSDTYSRQSNVVATILKSISIIIVVICIIGFIISITSEKEIIWISATTSIIIIVATAICSIFIYGFGEII